MLEPCAFQYSKQASEPAVNIMLMRQAPLVGRAGGLRGGKEEKKRKKMMKGKERDVIMLNLRQSSF